MTSSFFKPVINLFVYIFILTLFITCIFPIIDLEGKDFIYSDSEFLWPLPGYSYISSYFGYRNSPTAGASSYHSGIDIPSPSGTTIYAVCSGTVTFASWGAGGGYTIVVQNEELGLSFSYCHVSPIFIVSRGQTVYKGEAISTVGPKNVYGINDNPYKDSNGQPTNGATTGCHLHLTIKKDGQAVNPLNYVSIPN